MNRKSIYELDKETIKPISRKVSIPCNVVITIKNRPSKREAKGIAQSILEFARERWNLKPITDFSYRIVETNNDTKRR